MPIPVPGSVPRRVSVSVLGRVAPLSLSRVLVGVASVPWEGVATLALWAGGVASSASAPLPLSFGLTLLQPWVGGGCWAGVCLGL